MCRIAEWHPDYWVCACGHSYDHGELCDKDAERLRQLRSEAGLDIDQDMDERRVECRALCY